MRAMLAGGRTMPGCAGHMPYLQSYSL